MRTLLPALLLAPLAACFEPVEPDVEPADLNSGRWELHLTGLEASGDCAVIAVVQEPIDVIAYMEVDDDEVSLWMEGMALDGDIEGTHLSLSGAISTYGDYEDGDPGPDRPLPADEDDWSEPGCSGGDSGEDSGGAVILPACVEPEPYREEVRASLDADILAADLIRGELVVRYQDAWSDCRFSSELVGIQVEGDGDIGHPEPVEPMPEPYEEEPYVGEEHSEEDPGEEEGDRD